MCELPIGEEYYLVLVAFQHTPGSGESKKGVDTYLRLFLFRFLMCWTNWVSVALVSSSRHSQPGEKGWEPIPIGGKGAKLEKLYEYSG